MARSYSSSLRAEQAAMTRDRIVDAAVALLNRNDTAEIGMQDVADEAGVSVRTVYRYFATREDLFDGVVIALKDRMEKLAGPPPATPADVVDATRDAVRAVYELEPLYRALFATPAGRKSHQRAARPRRAHTYSPHQLEMGETEAKLFGALAHLLTASNSVLFLKDYWDLDAEETGRALEWAMQALMDAVNDPARRGQL